MNSCNQIYTEQEVQGFCIDLAKQIQDLNQEKLCFISILKGGLYFANEVIRNIDFTEKQDPVFGYLGLSSYGNEFEPEEGVKITHGIDLDYCILNGRNIWILDDISDRGLTLKFAEEILWDIQPNISSIKTGVMLDKPQVRNSYGFRAPDFSGVEVSKDDFLIGSGMGIGENYRYLKGIWQVNK